MALERRHKPGSARRAGVSVLGAALLSCGASPETYRPNQPTPYNVILVTLDGVRWQELFEGSDPLLVAEPKAVLPLFWERVAPRGVVYGDPRAGSAMTVATAANASLPGYTSLFAETNQGCLTNLCGRISVPTFLDRLGDELALPPEQLQVFASWPKLKLAVTGRDDVAQVHAGDFEAVDEASHPQRALLDDSFETDRLTVLNGFDALATQQPRFLYLSFLDSDRYGHANHYDRYLQVLGAYDRLLAELVDRLDAAGDVGQRTALVVTTDHGRGLWRQWQDHGPQTPSSARVWAFVMLPGAAKELRLVAPTARGFTHHDVRYTIETLFGLSTRGSTGFSTGFIEPAVAP